MIQPCRWISLFLCFGYFYARVLTVYAVTVEVVLRSGLVAE